VRILLVHPHLFKGGAEFQLIHLAKELQNSGHSVDIATLFVAEDIKEMLCGINVVAPDRPVTPRLELLDPSSVFAEIRNAIRLRELIKRIHHRYDIINPHNFPAVWACANLVKPVVWMCNEPPDPLWANPNPSILLRIIRSIGISVDKILVKSSVKRITVLDELNAKRVLERYGYPSDIVFSGVDYEYFANGNRDAAISKFDLKDKFVIIQVGWFTPQKNQLESIKAIEKIIDKIPDAKLVLVGRHDNAYGDKVRRYLFSSPIRDNVLLTGLIPMEDIRNLYAASSVVLFPAKSQTWGLPPIEGLCSGKISIVSPEAGVSTLLQREGIGIVTRDLSDALLQLYFNFSQYEIIAKRGQTYVKANLTWDKYCNRMIRSFESVLNDTQ
jgi:glycosyltransferase involved in cell wall biosynthesis